MNLSYAWLKELVDIDLTPEELAQKLTHAGCAIEEIVSVGDDKQLVAEVTTNRPDWLCHWGAAHEIAALLGKKVKRPEITLKETGPAVTTLATVRNDAKDLCPRYTARVIRGVTIKESPEWLKRKLTAVGLRPINNVVDITNYVLMEMNQPLHAFDYDLLNGHTIVVRRAKNGEQMESIDGTACKLTDAMLVIADAEKPVAIAGVMGGAYSEVSNKTVNILLESAYFEQKQVRRTSRALKLASDSSYRYERGIDPGSQERASARACQLILELAGGELATGVIDDNPQAGTPWKVTMRTARCHKLLGVEVPREKIEAAFVGLGLKIVDNKPEAITVEVPSFRQDLTREVDLIEEVIRVSGYHLVPETITMRVGMSHKTENESAKEAAREVLTGLGYFECVTDTFVPESWLAAFGCVGTPVRVLNPVNAKRPVLRTSMIPSLLEVNRINREETDVRLFEIARTYVGGDNRETLQLALLDVRGAEYVRGAFEAFLRQLRCEGKLTYRIPEQTPVMQDGSAMLIEWNGDVVGCFGVVKDEQMKMHDLRTAPALLQVELLPIAQAPRRTKVYKPLPRFPAIRRDIAMVVPENVKWADLERIVNEKPEMIEGVEFQSVYRGKGIDAGKKSVAFGVTYRHAERSMTDEEGNALRDDLVGRITKQIPDSSLRA